MAAIGSKEDKHRSDAPLTEDHEDPDEVHSHLPKRNIAL